MKMKSEYEKKAWRLVWTCLIAYTTVYIGRKNLSVCLPGMIAAGVTDKAAGGITGTCFMICYAAGQFINGWLGDRVHPRKMIVSGLFLAGIMNLLMGAAAHSWQFIPIWGCCGFCCSMLWSPILRAVSTWTTKEISQTAAASLTAAIPVGSILCYLICAAGLRLGGWRTAFFLCGGTLLVLDAAVFLLLRALRFHMAAPSAPSPADTVSGTSRPKTRILCAGLLFTAGGILFNGMLKDGLDLWIPTVLSEKFIPSPSAVSLICTILPVIHIFGAYAARDLFRRFRLDELTTCGVMFLISVLALSVAAVFIRRTPAESGVPLAVFVTVLLALSGASMLGANTMLLTFIPLHFGRIGRASTVTGMLNSFSYAAAAASSAVVGKASDIFGWTAVFALFIFAAAAGAVICLAGHKKMKEKTDELDGVES